MSVWILLAVFLLDGEPQVYDLTYNTKAECQADILEVTGTLLESNVQDASVKCVEFKIGSLS